MSGLFSSMTKLGESIAALTMAPVEIAIDLTNAALVPFVEAAEEIKAEIKACANT
jgi:hypothetical protein